MELSNRIKQLRIENQYTQKELSEKIGLTPKMISFYENGERTPPIDILIKLVNIFDVSSDYLLGLTNERHSIGDSKWRYPNVENRFGNNILIKYRERKGFSQEDFSKILGISQEMYKGIEGGAFVPSMRLIQKISSATGYEVDFLIGAIDHTSIPSGDTVEINGQSFSEYYSISDFTFRSRFEKLCLQRNVTNENCDKELAFTREEFIDVQYNRMPTLSELLRIAYSFNVSTDYLIGRTDRAMLQLTDDELELVLNYRDCLPHYQKNIFDRAEKLSIESINTFVAAEAPLKEAAGK